MPRSVRAGSCSQLIMSRSSLGAPVRHAQPAGLAPSSLTQAVIGSCSRPSHLRQAGDLCSPLCKHAHSGVVSKSLFDGLIRNAELLQRGEICD